jgi:hypothetical protein
VNPRFRNAIRALSGIPTVDYTALYPAKVLASKSGNRADVRADDDRIGALSNISVKQFAPDITLELTAGARCLLGFAEGDPSKPFAIAFDLAGSFTKLEIGSGGAECARKGDSVQVTIPTGTVMIPNPMGGPSIPNPAPITLNGVITSGSSKVKVIG